MRKAAFSMRADKFPRAVAPAQRLASRRNITAPLRVRETGNNKEPDVTRSILPALLLLGACGGEGERAAANGVGPDAPASEAELAQDAALANEAAAAEAADIEQYGGSAAAMDANRQ